MEIESRSTPLPADTVVNWSLERELGEPRRLAELFHLSKGTNTAVCEVWSHPLGWELRLEVSSELLLRIQLCRAESEVLSTSARWSQTLQEKGWRVTAAQ